MKDVISFEIEEKEKYIILSFYINENLTPSILKRIYPPKINTRKGVVLNGRGPIWLYGFLIHFYHSTPFLAIYDPRLGAVIIESHIPELKPGDILDIYLDKEG